MTENHLQGPIPLKQLTAPTATGESQQSKQNQQHGKKSKSDFNLIY